MPMKKIEAPTLADAYERAALELECSITELRYEVIQHPSSGILGLFKKSAIIFAECKKEPHAPSSEEVEPQEVAAIREIEEEIEHDDAAAELQDPVKADERAQQTARDFKAAQGSEQQGTRKAKEKKRKKHELDTALTQGDDAVLGSFFEKREPIVQQRPKNNNLELAEQIETELAELLSHSCFEIDTVEVDVVDNTALIFIDGEDAALLIGKEGYRYNALSYMLFNWLHYKYKLYIKLEIAQFLTTQQEMIHNYIQPVIEFVKENGRGKTRPLDGILVQIALEQLREVFPNKYVAVKTGRDGRKFVIINEFNTRRNA